MISRLSVRLVLVVALLSVALLWALFRWFLTADFLEFGDETMGFVAARQIVAGDRLYLDIFSQWGPGAMMLSWLAHVLGANSFPAFRVIVLFVQIGAAGALLASPAWKERETGMVAAAIFLALTAALAPIWLAHMLLYTTLGGHLCVATLALTLLPLLLDRPPPAWTYAVSAACWVFLIACAISFVPAATLFALITGLLLSRRGATAYVRPAIFTAIGAAFMLVVVLLWMTAFADFAGYWAEHIRFNSEIFTKYLYPRIETFTALDFVRRALLDPTSSDFAPVVTVMPLGLFGSVSLAATVRGKRASTAFFCFLIFALALYLNPRGGTIHHPGGPMIVCLALFAIGVAGAYASSLPKLGVVVLAAVPLYFAFGAYERATTIYGIGVEIAEVRGVGRNSGNLTSPMMRAIVAASDPEERIIAWEFLPSFYFYADRLPASPHMFLLAGQIDWLKQEGAGRFSHDPCADLVETKPPVIVMAYWSAQSVRDFAPCTAAYAEANYTAMNKTTPTLYVRHDRVARIPQDITSQLP